MHLDYELTQADFLAFNVHHASVSPSVARQRRRYRLILTLAPPLLASPLFLLLGYPWWTLAVGVAVVAPVAWLLAPYAWDRSLRRNLARMAAKQELGLAGHYRLTADDAGLHEDKPNGSIDAPWGSVLRVDESDEYAFIYIAPTQALVVPKRSDPAAVTALLAKARERQSAAAGSLEQALQADAPERAHNGGR